MNEPVTEETKLSPESVSALHACRLGMPYFRAQIGPQRAGRTRSIQGLLRRGIIEVHPRVMGAYELTEKGKRLAEAYKDG